MENLRKIGTSGFEEAVNFEQFNYERIIFDTSECDKDYLIYHLRQDMINHADLVRQKRYFKIENMDVVAYNNLSEVEVDDNDFILALLRTSDTVPSTNQSLFIQKFNIRYFNTSLSRLKIMIKNKRR